MDEIGDAVVNLCGVVPDGLVLFFPSYSYETQVFSRWKHSGALDRMAAKKTVHIVGFIFS